MSSKEQLVRFVETVPENFSLAILSLLKHHLEILEEFADNAFCLALEEAYEADSEKNDSISIEEFAAQLGVSLE